MMMPRNGSKTRRGRNLAPMARHGAAHRMRVVIAGLVLGVIWPGTGYGDPPGPQLPVHQIKIESALGQTNHNPPRVVWREKVTFKNNTGKRLVDAIVTSQPYSGSKDLEGRPGDGKTARELQKLVTFEIGETKTVVFEHELIQDPGRPGKLLPGFTSWYTDIYESEDDRKNGKKLWGLAGSYAFLPVRPGTGGVFTHSFHYPYPDVFVARNLGPTTFFLSLVEASLPSGWSLVDFGPGTFVLDPDESQLLWATFSSPPRIGPGETAYVELELAIPGEVQGPIYLGVTTVPEPTTVWLLGGGLIALAGAGWRRRSHPNRRRRITAYAIR